MQNKSLFDLLKESILEQIAEFINPANAKKPVSIKPGCPNCGITIEEIAMPPCKLGCPECYNHFKSDIMPVLMHSHECTKHIGKSPKVKINENPTKEEQIKLLKLQLTRAVEHEQYERAQEIKKHLIALSEVK